MARNLQHFDPSTRASDPGGIVLSVPKLMTFKRQLGWQQRWFGIGKKTPISEFAEHLMHADARAAILLETSPAVLVAAYSDDLDAVAILRFRPSVLDGLNLTSGARLLTVNSYRRHPAGASRVAPDLIAGPHYRHWYNFHPVIANFLAADPATVAHKMRSIPEDEWRNTMTLARSYRAQFPTRVRNGNPYLSVEPVV